MSSIIIISLTVVGIIGFFLFIALFMKRRHFVECEIMINVPKESAFEFLRFLRNQERFNKWAQTDPAKTIETKGTDGTVGFIYSWAGNKNAGSGEKEIKSIIEGKRIESEIRFSKPMRITASMIIETEALSESQTRVRVINAGTLNYPLNLMIPVAEKNFAKDLNSSLTTLKNILENKED